MKKIWRYNNSPPYVTARWPPQQISLLNFLDFSSTCVIIRAIPFKIHTPHVVDLQSTFHTGSIKGTSHDSIFQISLLSTLADIFAYLETLPYTSLHTKAVLQV